MVLWASTRRGAKSLADLVKIEIGPVAGAVGIFAILFTLTVALAGLGIAVVNALADSAWGTFTIAMTIPIGMFMGLWMYVWRKGRIAEATVIGVVAMLAAVAGGEPLNHPGSWLGSFFHLSRTQIALALCVYGFVASVMPVWLLLAPRGYLSSFTKIGTILLLAFGVMIVNPELKMPAFTEFAGGGGPIIPGPLFPFCFITIACGAISGFHALISSGTTSKMLDKETDIRPIGYGAMLVEGVVGIMALIAATAMPPADYFAINVAPAAYERLTFQGETMQHDLAPIEAAVGEKVEGRTGGAVSLAVGMAMIFSALPGMSGLLAYWYHFAIMFEALFILTTIDSGTRVGRFLIQEALGRVYAPFARTDWMPGAYIATALMVSCVGLLRLHRADRHHLADVRRRQPAARLRGARRRHHRAHQPGQGALHVGDAGAVRLPGRQHVLRRLPQRPRQLLAADVEQRAGGGHPGLRAVDLHGAHDDPGGGHPRRRRGQVGQRAVERPRADSGRERVIPDTGPLRAWLRAVATGVRQFMELCYLEPPGC